MANTTPSQRRYVSVEQYQAAYTECFNAKTEEMNERYSNVTEREKLMIYHANVARIADQQDLERFQENHISTLTLRKGALGQKIEKNINTAVDLLRQTAAQRGGFIKTLAEFCSPECAEILNDIQKEHEYSVKSNFVRIEALTHPLSKEQKEELFNPPSLTKTLFERFYNEESGKVESLNQEQMDQVLYAHSRHMGLINIGYGLPSSAPVLNYQTQEAQVSAGDISTAEKALDENTDILTLLVEDPALIGDSRKVPFEFANSKAQELHTFLIEHGIAKGLAEKIVRDSDIGSIEALQAALNDGTFRNIGGVGAEKEKKVKAALDTQPVANVSYTLESESETANTVKSQDARKPSGRRLKTSKSTADLVNQQNLVNQQQDQATLSRSHSVPLMKVKSFSEISNLESEYETATPGSESETATPGSEFETATPGSESETATPGSESETAIPGSESETAIPGSESETANTKSQGSFKSSGRRLKRTKSIPNLVSQQKDQATLSRSHSVPLMKDGSISETSNLESEYETATPGSESETATPGSESETATPGSESETATPGS